MSSAGAGPEALRLTEPELARWGEQLGRGLPDGAVVHLRGELGAGKTTLARALVRGLGATDAVSSPSYALVHHYHAPGGDIYHVDCFRLRHPAESADLDWPALAAARALVVEWPERAAGWVPAPSVTVELLHDPRDPDRRAVRRA